MSLEHISKLNLDEFVRLQTNLLTLEKHAEVEKAQVDISGLDFFMFYL